MLAAERTSRRVAPRGRQPLGAVVRGILAALLLTAPLAVPDALLHQHDGWELPCVGRSDLQTTSPCRATTTSIGARDGHPDDRAESDSLGAATGLCLACAQSSGHARLEAALAGIARTRADGRLLATAPTPSTPDGLAAGDPAPRAPPRA